MMKKGFTLIEIMTAVSIFAIVMTISMGSIIGVFDTNRKSEALRSVMDNLNLSVESMSREMRFGREYDCGDDGDPFVCSLAPGDQISFTASNGSRITYRQSGTAIEKKVGGGGFLPVTSPEIEIESLAFYVLGAIAGDGLQPKVIIRIEGSAGTKEIAETDFTVQTMVSQRQLDS